jgi:glycosyltransferase involved in cell wall biosynthesis
MDRNPGDRLPPWAPMTASPRVSIAIPVYNGADTIRQTVESALAQTYSDLEVVVVDNASTDGTAEIVASFDDPRIRLHRNPTNLGFLPNHDLSFQLARGEFIKPLHADDRLLAPCVERMLEVFDAHERVGLVFAPRRIELADEANPELVEWRELFARPDRNFSSLEEVNDGRRLLGEYLRAGIPDNWVGEPSCLMLRRSAVARIGLFSPKVNALNDLDMSIRMLAVSDVGFIDEELSVYRREIGSLIHELKGREWLDRLWMLEGLAALPGVPEAVPELGPALGRERAEVARRLVRFARRQPDVLPEKLRDLGRYAAYRAAVAAGRAPRLHAPLLPPPPRPEVASGVGVGV